MWATVVHLVAVGAARATVVLVVVDAIGTLVDVVATLASTGASPSAAIVVVVDSVVVLARVVVELMALDSVVSARSSSSPCSSGPAVHPAADGGRHDGQYERSDAEGTGHHPSVTRRPDRRPLTRRSLTPRPAACAGTTRALDRAHRASVRRVRR